MPGSRNCSVKIRKCFEKHCLGIGAVHAIFCGFVAAGSNQCFPLRDHDFSGENQNGVGLTPKTNDGFKCFDVTGKENNNSHLAELLVCFGSMMDAVQLTVDEVQGKFGCKRMFDDIM
jgi:hypothetical protein